jgi:hypothetical protein
MGGFQLALGVGADLSCGAALGAVRIKANVGVKVGESSPIIPLTEMNEREQAINFGVLWGERFRRFRRVQSGFETHAIANPGIRI